MLEALPEIAARTCGADRYAVIADSTVARLFGERVSGYDLLIKLGASLRETVGVEELLPRLATTIRAGLGDMSPDPGD